MPKSKGVTFFTFENRQTELIRRRNLKMARSAHAYVRGNTLKFYEWLETTQGKAIPEGPPVWICGDCHVGNLGPTANAKGKIDLQIRDLDQTVIGNPAHDLIRLGLSLASAARGSDLPGVTTAKMLEQMMEGYEESFDKVSDKNEDDTLHPDSVKKALKIAMKRSWKHLAHERIENAKPNIPLGKRFWPLSKKEKLEIGKLFKMEDVRRLVTSLSSRDDKAPIEVLDAAFWVKGCSSLGRLRYAVLLGVDDAADDAGGLCLMDIKEAVQAAAPRHKDAQMPRENAERVATGARHLAPYLGERMLGARFLDKSVFLRELLPQDLKIEIDELTQDEAMKTARYLAYVVGKAHARQMHAKTRRKWQHTLHQNRSKSLDAPSWLWSSIVELIVTHESAYLEHCRKYATQAAA